MSLSMLTPKIDMTLEQQVVSLELAERLKALNVKQESLFYWQHNFGKGVVKLHSEMIKRFGLEFRRDICETADVKQTCSAFTVAELGEMLPNMIVWLGVEAWFETMKDLKNRWFVAYTYKEENDSLVFSADTEADARAKALIYLIENSLIPLPIK